MFTDIVGFTSLAQKDEALAMQLLSGHNDMMRSVLKDYGGREVKMIGDAFLVEFPNALDAVRCAFAIQAALRSRNEGLPTSRRILVRVGIHLGDVIHEKGDILGDAVNVSSRIVALAEPGGVCISGQVYDHVRNKVQFQFVKMEAKELKNVLLPVDLYRGTMPWESGPPEADAKLDRRRVAVLPLRNMSPDPNDEYFADGMTEELIASLASIRELTVIARTSVMQYKNVSKRVTEIGRELGAGSLIEGSVRKAGNKVRITVQLIDAQVDGHIWAQSYDKELDDVFAVQTAIAEKVAEQLRVRLVGTERVRLEKRPSSNSEAHLLYLKGRYYWNERTEKGIEKAIVYFTEAIKLDPGFALGYAGLASCHSVMARNGMAEPEPGFRKAQEFALKALSLDRDLAEAHTVLAATLSELDRDFVKAEAEYKTAIGLNPNYATARQWYAHVLCSERRFGEMKAEITKAHELDPMSPIISVNLGDGLYYEGRFDEAIAQFLAVVDSNPEFEVVYPSLIQVYLRNGMFPQALEQLETYARLTNDPTGEKLERAYVYAAMGKSEEARQLLGQVKSSYQKELVSPYTIALVYFTLHDDDEAFGWLQRSYDRYDGNIGNMGVDFELDRVRSDPRYLAMLEKVGLRPLIANE